MPVVNDTKRHTHAIEVKSSNAGAATSSPAAAPTVPPPSVRAFLLAPFSTPAQLGVSQTQAQLSQKSVVVNVPKRHKHGHMYLVPTEPPEDAIAEYVQALNDANIARSNVDRARGLYRAAVLAGNF